jgi:hypothetical protein
MNIATDRRSFMKWAAALPLLGTIAIRGAFDRAMAAVTARGKDFNNNIYTRIGVRPLINARGHWTYLSSTLELPEERLLAATSRPRSFLSRSRARSFARGHSAVIYAVSARC